ncbi:hypothetical protein [Lysobacter gummosus]|uniref:hypothetical protein n=1 Tax=Lysobacter gummosus TaxID=262324 RepID=UPI003634D701
MPGRGIGRGRRSPPGPGRSVRQDPAGAGSRKRGRPPAPGAAKAPDASWLSSRPGSR